MIIRKTTVILLVILSLAATIFVAIEGYRDREQQIIYNDTLKKDVEFYTEQCEVLRDKYAEEKEYSRRLNISLDVRDAEIAQWEAEV